MATFKSEEYTKVTKLPANEELKPTEQSGNLIIHSATFVVPVGGVAVGEFIELFELQKGERIVGSQLAIDWMADPAATVINHRRIKTGNK